MPEEEGEKEKHSEGRGLGTEEIIILQDPSANNLQRVVLQWVLLDNLVP